MRRRTILVGALIVVVVVVVAMFSRGRNSNVDLGDHHVPELDVASPWGGGCHRPVGHHTRSNRGRTYPGHMSDAPGSLAHLKVQLSAGGGDGCY